MKLLIAIPAFNEEASISSVISQIKSELPSALPLVINDGSFDRTAFIAKKAGAAVISMPFNVGVGGAVRVAFRYAFENGFDRVIQIDADGQHLPSEAKLLLDTVTENGIVVGSRFLEKSKLYNVSWARRIAMIILATITSKICKTKLTDVTSGFRIASGKAIELFAHEYPREYLGDTVESLIIAHRNKIQIREVPVIMKAREHGAPSQNLIKSMWYLLRAILVIALAAIKKSKD